MDVSQILDMQFRSAVWVGGYRVRICDVGSCEGG